MYTNCVLSTVSQCLWIALIQSDSESADPDTPQNSKCPERPVSVLHTAFCPAPFIQTILWKWWPTEVDQCVCLPNNQDGQWQGTAFGDQEVQLQGDPATTICWGIWNYRPIRLHWHHQDKGKSVTVRDRLPAVSCKRVSFCCMIFLMGHKECVTVSNQPLTVSLWKVSP